MLAKAATLPVDMAFVDLEDAVPPAQKTDDTRARAARALTEQTWRAPTLAVRVNALATEWGIRDVAVVVERAGASLDCIVLPKIETVDDVEAADLLLSELEATFAVGRRIGLEAQIESARGLVEVERIASSSSRLEALVFGPGDYAASLGVVQRSIGAIDPAYPGDQWHYARSRIATAAHAFGLVPVDGPYAAIGDLTGLRESALRARLVGFQGKWVVHPDQVVVVNEVFSPTDAELEQAHRVLDALGQAADAGRGAALFEGEMIDEASRRLAEAVVSRALAAGLESG
ncbi:MAG: CoA ester lyase [Actinomycetota bacterium]|nr:CoA ester lyase [Actinomycetota bacterium]